MRWFVRRAARLVVMLLLACVRPRRGAVVFGIPDSEGNAVEVLRWLLRNSSIPITWLTAHGDAVRVIWLLDDVPGSSRVVVVRRGSLKGFLAFLRAGSHFYTRHFYSSPPPIRGRVRVNLWHGDGPKLSMPGEAPSTDSVAVAGCELWGQDKARLFGLPRGRVLVVGNPRVDQFDRPASDEALRSIGVDPSRPLVLWAPTFREGGVGHKAVRDAARLSETVVADELEHR